VRYALQRFLQFLLVFFLVTFFVLVATRIGLKDPARSLLGGTATQQQIDTITAKYHLDSNYFVQYFYWLKNLLTGNMGRSEVFSTDVSTLIVQKIMPTLLLGVYAMVLALLISVPLGVWSAYRRDGYFDKAGSFLSFAFVSTPALVLGVLFSLVFVNHFGHFPRVSDKVYPWDDPYQHFRNFFLPTITLALPIAAVFTRLLRSDMVLTLQSDYITLARAKGMSPRRILWRHALRGSLFSLMTAIGLQLGALLGGAVVVEQLFGLGGLGKLLTEGILRADLLVVQACAAILVISVVVVNFVIDLLYAVVDPRIRHARALG
jgi:peptide/nickel transport system permease protein